MNYEAAIIYAQQRMREIGKKPSEYHFEPVRISPTAQEQTTGTIHIAANNELYILVNPQNYYGFYILSDTCAYNADDVRNSGVAEFSGSLHITKSAVTWNLQETMNPLDGMPIKAIPLEFLRVVIY